MKTKIKKNPNHGFFLLDYKVIKSTINLVKLEILFELVVQLTYYYFIIIFRKNNNYD